MKFLLTSAGITNDSIHAALVDLLGKPTAEARAICVPTAIYALPGGNGYAWRMLRELADIGWHDLGVLELTTLPTILEEHWLPAVEAADIIIVGGGNSGYLCYWIEQSGFGRRLPALLQNKVYMGVSAGSLIVTHSFQIDAEVLARTGIYRDADYDEDAPPNAGSNKTLGLVDFVIRPHLNADWLPQATLDRFAKSAAKIDVPMYAFDDQTAIKVVDGNVEVISEGEWKLFDKA